LFGSQGNVSIFFQWFPEEQSLQFMKKKNFHNQNLFRTDGLFIEPHLLAFLKIDFPDDRVPISFKAGGFKAAGLESINTFTKNLYFLEQPLPLLHTTHYDKGFEVSYSGERLRLKLSAIDGDWKIGETNLFNMEESFQNSYPSLAGSIDFETEHFEIGASGTRGDIGSYPGEKRRKDDLAVYFKIIFENITARVSGTVAHRNLEGDGLGRHSDPVKTYGGVFELSRIQKLPGNWGYLETTGHVWGMKNHNGDDGEIWFNNVEKSWGWGAGIGWKRGVVRTRLFYGQIDYGKTESIMVFNIGVDL
jgi:hypothetical protein